MEFFFIPDWEHQRFHDLIKIAETTVPYSEEYNNILLEVFEGPNLTQVKELIRHNNGVWAFLHKGCGIVKASRTYHPRRADFLELLEILKDKAFEGLLAA